MEILFLFSIAQEILYCYYNYYYCCFYYYKNYFFVIFISKTVMLSLFLFIYLLDI